jgi:hypothetical protein
VERAKHFEHVPVAFGVEELALSAVPQILTVEEAGVQPPDGRLCESRRSYFHAQGFVIRKGGVYNVGGEGAGSEVARSKNMVQPR